MSSFADKEKWKRHRAVVFKDNQVYCANCRTVLPISIVPGTIVLTRYDRLYIGDLDEPNVVDCAL